MTEEQLKVINDITIRIYDKYNRITSTETSPGILIEYLLNRRDELKSVDSFVELLNDYDKD